MLKNSSHRIAYRNMMQVRAGFGTAFAVCARARARDQLYK